MEDRLLEVVRSALRRISARHRLTERQQRDLEARLVEELQARLEDGGDSQPDLWEGPFLHVRVARLALELANRYRSKQSRPRSATEARALLEESWQLVLDVARSVCHRRGVFDERVEDFSSILGLKLVENDYAAIRQWNESAGLSAYLASVASRLFIDELRRDGGRFRASAAATRLGEVARRFEELRFRDGLTLEEAGQILRSRGYDCSDLELADIEARLPSRCRPRIEFPGELDYEGRRSERPDVRFAEAQQSERLREAEERFWALAESVYDIEEVVILDLHLRGVSTRRVAKMFGLDDKKLYRKLARMKLVLAGQLRDEGFDPEDLFGEGF